MLESATITIKEGQQEWKRPITSGLMSGLKLTTVIGTLVNYVYYRLTDTEVANPTFQGDDSTMELSSYHQAFSILKKYASMGLKVHPRKN
jgi:hypothetical protein